MGADAHTEHAGASSEPSVTHEEHRNELWWSKVREYGQEFFSEFFGTMVLILFASLGDGDWVSCSASTLLARPAATSTLP
ncbi:hypothetical protein HYQ44_004377 [Verticillium longisporum]|nr:hypothetical protein HYQ44_004377 [Verticillium longisporum]